MSEILVKGQGVARQFRQGGGDIVALRPSSFEIHSGDRIALLGRSGSGKSTLLDLIADLDASTAGIVTWPALGRHGTLRPLSIGIVFQTPSLIPTLNVVENVEVPMRLTGHFQSPRAEAMQALVALGLAGIANKLPNELSGGQAQRVSLARAIAIKPKLILADEPTGQLDHPTGKLVMDALLASIEGTDAALVVATHDFIVAERMKITWHIDYGKLETSAVMERT